MSSAPLSTDASTLLQRALAAELAVDLTPPPAEARVTSDRLVEVLHRAEASSLDERAIWNLLFVAGELSLRVDVYRAHDLFRAVAALIERVGAGPLTPGDPRAAALEMGFDFFFARPSHPLLPLRATLVLETLGSLLASERRAVVRAAIHGLGHLATRDGAAVALLDRYLAGRIGTKPDEGLAEYARDARRGALR